MWRKPLAQSPEGPAYGNSSREPWEAGTAGQGTEAGRGKAYFTLCSGYLAQRDR